MLFLPNWIGELERFIFNKSDAMDASKAASNVLTAVSEGVNLLPLKKQQVSWGLSIATDALKSWLR